MLVLKVEGQEGGSKERKSSSCFIIFLVPLASQDAAWGQLSQMPHMYH